MSKGVFCYRNLNRKGVVWSIKSNKTGLVLARQEYVIIRNAELVVSLKGWERVRKEGQRNVHAGIKGTWVRGDFNQYLEDWRAFTGVYGDDGNKIEWVKICYNPYEACTFFREDNGRPVTHADTVVLDRNGAWALQPIFANKIGKSK